MDFLNKTFAQVKDLFAAMTPGARITAGLLLVVVVVSLAYLFHSRTPGADEYLLAGRSFSSSELHAIEGALAKAGLGGYQIEGSRVRIPRGQKARYIGAMAEGNALPDSFNDYFDAATREASPFMSERDRLAREKNAKRKELALVLRSMKGIEKATVEYDSVVKRGFPRVEEVTAMVAVKPMGSGELDPDVIRSIRQLVSRAIGGLKPENVSVTDLNSGRTDFGGNELSGGSNNAYYEAKTSYEEFWRGKIRSALAYVPGAIVAVNVELDPSLIHSHDRLTYNDKPVVIESTDETLTSTTTAPVPAGRPGVVAQGANLPMKTGASGGGSQVEESRATQRNITGQERTFSNRASLVPNDVTVSVVVPSSYYEQVWRRRHPPAEGEAPRSPEPRDLAAVEAAVVTEIEETVLNLLPKLPQGVDPYPRVKVTSFQDMPGELEAEPPLADTAVTWLGSNWSTLGMVAVGLLSLLMVRSMVRSAAPSAAAGGSARRDADGGAKGPQGDAEGGAAQEEKKPERVLKRKFDMNGPNLREELNALVQEDPDAAVNILRSWIGSVD